jgi:hypothetical protein
MSHEPGQRRDSWRIPQEAASGSVEHASKASELEAQVQSQSVVSAFEAHTCDLLDPV